MRMAQSSSVFAFMGHANPTLVRVVSETGGGYAIGDVCDPQQVSQYASANDIDIAMVSSDNPLEAGVVDALIAAGVPTVGPTRDGAEIEWNKAYSRQMVARIEPAANPRYMLATSLDTLESAISGMTGDGLDVVIKPVGLTGGKGVKVVGPHLADNAAAYDYGASIIDSGRHGGAVLVEERVNAPEFTIQAMTDGRRVVFPPATYDYPYRFEGDRGPGTGGMGSYSQADGLLPFLDKSTYEHACQIVQDALECLAGEGRRFSGCVNAGFFATEEGPKVIEFNSRFGDPEGLNIMTLFEGDWIDVMGAMYHQSLNDGLVPMARESSIVVYLVSPEYALEPAGQHRFTLDVDKASAAGVQVCFSAAVEEGPGQFVTVGTSRAVAFAGRAPRLDAARTRVYNAIDLAVTGPLEKRGDIGKI
ncbi:MAG: hypothetical protein M1420_03355 [Actinobacteria bacterium]|nr:hypothetical protein [Actinomycetota bacterium]